MSTDTFAIWPAGSPHLAAGIPAETSTAIVEPATGPAISVTNVSEPTLTRYAPPQDKAHGGAVIVLPGGAFRCLMVDKEGAEIATWFAERGYVAFVLKYRVHDSDDDHLSRLLTVRAWRQAMQLMLPGRMLAADDARQAVRTVRSGAVAFGVDPTRIGMIGFSAGAITTATTLLGADVASRPDFGAVIYGAMPDEPVPHDAPPVFLVHADDDPLVPVGESVRMFEAWQARGRPSDLHRFDAGGHGFGMRRLGLPVDAWPQDLDRWLNRHGFNSPLGPPNRTDGTV
ncbi:MAG: alpha/beta hydrolase [Phenylobacterium sp.]|uniref:alpha/beta hydrolase n=1 Tax=Phenylobacterium sp. TaxID=1871053 RepID=UPI0027361132|nr:alpha/beta hydrolase [Phenylobacterium sp.]MDP3748640.1 alpha/beta hydrolase [Phenylobacterium sp.]